jgi:lysophospholipase L1-like esterase
VNEARKLADRLRDTRAVLVFYSLLLVAACGDDIPQLSPLARDAVILAFGDSLTRGTGAGDAQSYPAQLQALTGRRVVNAGVPGELSVDGLARLPSVLEDTKPALLLLCHGANDMLRKKNLSKATKNIRDMITLARQRNVPVVLIGVPKPGLLLSTADFYAEIAAGAGIPSELDVVAEIVSDPSLKSDAVHPNAQGYRKMAEAVFELLRSSGAL